jgi:S1-C subfamily serine protease
MIRFTLVGCLSVTVALWASRATAEPTAAPYCSGEYADDLSQLASRAREVERHPYSFCVRSTVTYECLSYATDGTVRRQKKRARAHGTAFAYRQQGADTLLLTNDHVAEWPAVTDEAHPVEGVPPGCKRVNDSLRLVDNESDDYDLDDINLSRVVADRELDAAVLRAKTTLPVLPWKIGRSAQLRERNIVEVRGFPLGVFRATNAGKVISAYDHDDYKEWDHDDFVIDALLSTGNSGSPVFAVSCKTGEFELVGMYHAGYSEASALNVVVGIDQIREMMTTLKRPNRTKGDAAVALDMAARRQLIDATRGSPAPFFPLGPLTAEVRVRTDQTLVFQVYARDFPRRTTPLFAFEDLPPSTGRGFGQMGRIWFGSHVGLRSYRSTELDADAQATLDHLVEALRRDALAHFDWRKRSREPARSRADYDRLARFERMLDRTSETRRDLAQAATDVADRLSPRRGDPRIVRTAELLLPVSAPQLADRITPSKPGILAPPKPPAPPPPSSQLP